MNEGEDGFHFENLEHLLMLANTPFSPAYIHGFMAGMLCTGADTLKCWARAQEILSLDDKKENEERKDIVRKLFGKLFLLTVSMLQDLEPSFFLMLPDDNAPLSQRVEALGDCCEGFLMGIKLVGGTTDKLHHNTTIKEILEDFEHMTHIAVQPVESQENEKAYVELVEFVRVGILLAYAQCPDQSVKLDNSLFEYRSQQIH